jgi:hypothetical protein
MDIEPAYSQNLVPRLTQHPVRRQTIQSVVHPAADNGTDYTADGTANRGRYGHHCIPLRGLVAVIRLDAARSGTSTCAGTRSCPCPRACACA